MSHTRPSTVEQAASGPPGSSTAAPSARCCRPRLRALFLTSAVVPDSSYASCSTTATTPRASTSARSTASWPGPGARAARVEELRHGDSRALLRARPCGLAAVTATDLLEHLTKPEVLGTFD